jgi:hypothetical protein
MAQLVVLLPASKSDPSLGPNVVAALSRLGVTSLSVARNDQTIAVVLEGWAFDPGAPAAVLAALGVPAVEAKLLRPFVQMTVSAVS